jgi:hypothetical protein
MGEYYPGQITIGGKITRTDFVRLFLVAKNSNVGLGYDDQGIGETPQDLLDILTGADDLQFDPLRLCSVEANYGRLPDLEEFCRKHKLTYHQRSEARYEYDGEISWWKPGMKQEQSTTATQDGVPTISLLELVAAIDKKRTAKDKLAAVIKLLKENNPCEMPDLQVIDDGFDLDNWKTIDLED